jgi:hypothetical protein
VFFEESGNPYPEISEPRHAVFPAFWLSGAVAHYAFSPGAAGMRRECSLVAGSALDPVGARLAASIVSTRVLQVKLFWPLLPPLEFLDDRYRGIVQLSHGEQNLERGILLFEESSQIRFPSQYPDRRADEDTDGFEQLESGRTVGEMLKCDDRKQRAKESASEREQDSGRYDGHVASGNYAPISPALASS